MHLKIIQNGEESNVPSEVVTKLYNLSMANQLQPNDLQGTIYVSNTYPEYKQRLESLHPNFHINVGAFYILFDDEEVTNVLTTQGVLIPGSGLTPTQASQVQIGESWFENNTSIQTFDELKYFNPVGNRNSFKNCTSLTSVDLSDRTYIGGGEFQGCTSLVYFNGEGSENGLLTLNKVTKLDAECFRDCDGLTKVDLTGAPITGFGASVFEDCDNLTEAILSTSRTVLYREMFQGCENLTTVNLTHVTSMGELNFDGCINLEYFEGEGSVSGRLNLPNLSTIQSGNFKDCKKLKNVYYLGSATRIPDNCFRNCIGLTDANLSNITEIATLAFSGCTSLVNITLSNTLDYVEKNDAFSNVPWYTNIYQSASDGPILIGKTIYAYKGTIPSIIDLSNQSGAKMLTGGLFYGNHTITSISLPSSVIRIGTQALKECTNLTSIDLSNVEVFDQGACQYIGISGNLSLDSVKTMGMNAFSNLAITSVTIGASVNTIYAQAFKGSSNLTTVTVKALTPPTLYGDTFVNTSLAHIYVPSGSVAAYKAKSGWSDFSSIIEAIPT